MGDFDKILKENIEAVFLPVTEKILGISIKESFPKGMPFPGNPSPCQRHPFGEGMPLAWIGTS